MVKAGGGRPTNRLERFNMSTICPLTGPASRAHGPATGRLQHGFVALTAPEDGRAAQAAPRRGSIRARPFNRRDLWPLPPHEGEEHARRHHAAPRASTGEPDPASRKRGRTGRAWREAGGGDASVRSRSGRTAAFRTE